MTQKSFVVVAMCLVCAVLRGADTPAGKQVRVYPTPKRLELTGGVSKVRPGEVKFRRVDGLGPEGYRIVATRDAVTVEVTAKAGGFYAK